MCKRIDKGFFLLALLFIFTFTALPVLAGDNEDFIIEGEVRLGAVKFKVVENLRTDLPLIDGAERFGIDHIDQFMDEIGATRVERTHPHTPRPEPGKTDLTLNYTMFFPTNLDVWGVSRDLYKLSGIVWAEPWYIYEICLDHNDPRRDDQYALDLMEANRAHDVHTGDEETVIAISDNGTDWDHEDLFANIWINPGEDLNGNGRIDNNERNNRDDDNNGYTDDFYGWDLNQNDNDPNDDVNHGHGTHTAGSASAVTNNEVGIASVAYQCKLMIARCGRGRAITHGAESIVYAVDAGADIINCSWGGGQASADMRDAVAHAEDEDVLIIAAAGNNNSNRIFYPAGFNTVLSVAATNSRDNKANFSNFGDWIDVCAPGVNILSTMPGNRYAEMDGTSMASPNVASVAGLLRSYFPDMTAEVARMFLAAGVEDIGDDRLGNGRINAYYVLHAIENPILEIGELEMTREEGRNDRFDPGEQVEFEIEIKNFGLDAEQVVARIMCEDEDLSFINDESEIGVIGTGQMVTNDDDPFVLVAREDMIPHTTVLTVQITGQPNDQFIEQDYEVLIGHPSVLIVDDDDGAEYEEVYNQSVIALNKGYLRWDVFENSYPGPDIILDYDIVFWFTGHAFPPIDRDEQWTMQQAVEDGANILLSGKWIGDNYNDNGEFLRQVFGVNHREDSVDVDYVRGIGDQPIPEDLYIRLDNPDLGENDTLNAKISPSTCAERFTSHALCEYMKDDEVAGVAGIYQHIRQTGAHTAYLGFNIEMASDYAGPRTQFLAHIMDWMTDYNATPIPEEPAPVTILLNPAYPNPFNNQVALNYQVPQNTRYSLTIFDAAGREVSVLQKGIASKQQHQATWNAKGITSGVYYAILNAQGIGVQNQKLILVK